MTTDPGDLVLDPTCGSGTAAYVAEKWGRRWITCDTSRVAVTLAKQRLMTASYDYYRSEEHTSELQSLMRISYAVFCLKKKKNSTRSHLLLHLLNQPLHP